MSLRVGVEVTGNIGLNPCSKKGSGETGKYDLTYLGKKKEEMSMRIALSLWVFFMVSILYLKTKQKTKSV